MVYSLTGANAAWLIHANMVWFEQILDGELTAVQRRNVERLLANERASLAALDRSDPVV